MSARRWTFGALAIAALCGFAVLQFASEAIFSSAGTPPSLAAHIPPSFGERVYGAVERVAPLAFVEQMLALAALNRNDPQTAWQHVVRMKPSAARSDLAARIALARGDSSAAVSAFLAAADVPAVQSEVDRLQQSGQVEAAYALEAAIRRQLQHTATHPDAVAESYWRSGQLSTELARRNLRRRGYWMQTGLADYRRALALAPFSEKYLLAAGTQELDLQQDKAARSYFQRSVEVDPESAEAYAGLGMAAFERGDRAVALTFAARSRALDPNSKMLARLDRSLR